ncbi:MAG: sterol desaturase family protein [Myxococcota bacterium]
MRPFTFPATLLGAPLATFALMRWGLAPGGALTTVLLSLILLLTLVERAAPYVEEWNRPRNDTRTDLLYVLLLSIPDKLTRVLAEALLTSLAGLVVTAGWSGDWSGASLVAASLVAFLVGDLGKYGIHRLSHEHAALWPIHAVHHAPERLYTLNGLRVHPLNVAWNTACDVVPALLFGLPAEAVALMGAVRGAVSLLQHVNTPVAPSLLHVVFNSPNAHRWHHSKDLAESNTNYGSALIIWDRLFGTLKPDTAHPARLGIDDNAGMPSSYLGQTLYPVCRERLLVACFTPRIRELLR